MNRVVKRGGTEWNKETKGKKEKGVQGKEKGWDKNILEAGD